MGVPSERVRFTRLPLEALGEPDRALLELWQAKRAGRRAPARSEFDAVELKALLPRLLLIEVRRDPLDFIYRLAGTAIYDIHGMELTGKSVRGLYPKPYAEEVWNALAEIVRTCEPQHSRLEFTNQHGRSRSYSVLRLPLSADGTTVDRVFVLSIYGADRRQIQEMYHQHRP